eukprot:Hpha_TRINITY_DN30641_c0_g1::TRINITY_DN30641_c0_g1_i1::g.18365::m.18365
MAYERELGGHPPLAHEGHSRAQAVGLAPGELIVVVPGGQEHVLGAGPSFRARLAELGGGVLPTLYDAPPHAGGRRVSASDVVRLAQLERVYADTEHSFHPMHYPPLIYFPGEPDLGLTSHLRIYNPGPLPCVYRLLPGGELRSFSERQGVGEALRVQHPHGSGAQLGPGEEVAVGIEVTNEEVGSELRQRQEGVVGGYYLNLEMTDGVGDDGLPTSTPAVERVAVMFGEPPADAVYDITQAGGQHYCNLPEDWWERAAEAAPPPTPPQLDGPTETVSDSHAVLRDLFATSALLRQEEDREMHYRRLEGQLRNQLSLWTAQRDLALARLRQIASEQVEHESRLGEQRREDDEEAQQQNRRLSELTKKVEDAERQLQVLRGDIQREEAEKNAMRLRNQMLAQSNEQMERGMVEQLMEIESALRVCEQHKKDDTCTIA